MNQECPVCFETKKLLPWQNPDCRHGFCSECIETLVEDEHTCPLCRREWIEDLPVGLRDEYINNNGPRRASLVGSLHKVTRAVIICLQFAFNFYIIFLKFEIQIGYKFVLQRTHDTGCNWLEWRRAIEYFVFEISRKCYKIGA